MTDEMLVAQAEWLPQYDDAIAAAKERLESGDLIPTNDDYEGAARKHTKTVEEMEADRKAQEMAKEADKRD